MNEYGWELKDEKELTRMIISCKRSIMWYKTAFWIMPAFIIAIGADCLIEQGRQFPWFMLGLYGLLLANHRSSVAGQNRLIKLYQGHIDKQRATSAATS